MWPKVQSKMEFCFSHLSELSVVHLIIHFEWNWLLVYSVTTGNPIFHHRDNHCPVREHSLGTQANHCQINYIRPLSQVRSNRVSSIGSVNVHI